jgi:hypothetical protein
LGLILAGALSFVKSRIGSVPFPFLAGTAAKIILGWAAGQNGLPKATFAG